MIPGAIVRFLEQRANLAYAGTRDRDLVPHGHRVCGWRLDGTGHRLRVCFPEQSLAHLVASLDDNGLLAVTVEEAPSHETYQFKGRALGHGPPGDEDVRAVDRVRVRFVRGLRPIFTHLPEPALAAFVAPPRLAVDLEVREIFLQTPGPGAGGRIVPPPEGAA